MSVESETDVFLSLAQLAMMNTDDVATITSRVPPAGIYHVLCKKVEGKEAEPVEGKPPLIRFAYAYEILWAKPTDKNVDGEKMIGRVLTESYTLWPSDVEAGIGLLKGRYQKVGLPNTGMLGGDPSGEPGWLDGALEAEFDIQIRTGVKDGEQRAYYDWVKPDPKLAAAREAAATGDTDESQPQAEVQAG